MKTDEKDLTLSLKYKLADRNIQRDIEKIDEKNKEVIRQTTEAALLFINNKQYFKLLVKDKELIKKQEVIIDFLSKSFPLLDEKIISKLLFKSFYFNKTYYNRTFTTISVISSIIVFIPFLFTNNDMFLVGCISINLLSIFFYDYLKYHKV